MNIAIKVIVPAGFALAASSSFAGFLNASFESPALANFVFNSAIDNWSQSDVTSGVWHTNSFYFSDPTPDGVQVAYINAGSIAQVSNDLIGLGHNEVSFSFGRRLDGYQGGAQVLMTAGGTATNGDIVGRTVLKTFNLNGLNQPFGTWTTWTMSYDAASGDSNIGKALGIEFTITSGSQVEFDNVHDVVGTQAVPEPVSLTALSLGVVGLIRRKRSR